MLKQFYENMKSALEAQYKERPRALLPINIQLASTLLDVYREDAKVVWASFYSFPMELLAAFDVAPFDYEIATNLLPMMDADGCVNIMSKAEEEGYSTDLCSFHRLAMGCQMLGYMPKAELLLSSSYFCDGKAKLNQVIANYHGREAITLDVPNRIDKESIAYVSRQLQGIAGRLEKVAGHKLDHDRLRECIRAFNRAKNAYGRLAEVQKIKPFPWNGAVAVNMSIFGNLMAGKQIQERLYQDLVDECSAKLAGGRLTPEKYRVLWLAWFPEQPTNINEIFKKSGVSIVMGELERIFWDEIDEKNPWEGMALWCLKNPYVGPIEQRMAGIIQMVDEYDVDGVIHFSADACRHSCAAHRMIADELQKKNIPFIVLEGDMSDKRKYSEERSRLLLESFVDVMSGRKKEIKYSRLAGN
ncbi:MAG: 2-hydroxyacyl-CoA dehydratase family protein [Dehalococcoidia bacterium]|nr:2-hydroxyacyl-CoA dehydratase family protein [Dehalococcoidia bacterium]MDD5493202.1 2-hydroxyacyl-CoA dehydratase family protein [Dehalococcoidia bacterium]